MKDDIRRVEEINTDIRAKEKLLSNYATTQDRNERRRQLANEKRWVVIINAVGSELKCPVCARKIEQSNAWTLTTDPIQCRSCAQKGTRQHRSTGTLLDYASIDYPYITNMKNLLCQVMIRGLRAKANTSIASLAEKAGVAIPVIKTAESDGFISLEDAASLLRALDMPLSTITITVK
tara:strand:- start:326 stop:859 length:534 start_codon:yes stop_codon:yes gene_type:complete